MKPDKLIFRNSEPMSEINNNDTKTCACATLYCYGDSEQSFRDSFCLKCTSKKCFWYGLEHKHCHDCGQVASNYKIFERLENEFKKHGKKAVLEKLEYSKKLVFESKEQKSTSGSDDTVVSNSDEDFHSVKSTLN